MDVNQPKKNQTDKQFITWVKKQLSYCSVGEWGLGRDTFSHVFISVLIQHTVYYFRNFEESEDELRNEVVESLEKLATFNEAEKKEEVSSSSKDAGNLEKTEGLGMQKYSELNEGLETIFIPSDDKICIGNEDQGISTTSQNIQL